MNTGHAAGVVLTKTLAELQLGQYRHEGELLIPPCNCSLPGFSRPAIVGVVEALVVAPSLTLKVNSPIPGTGAGLKAFQRIHSSSLVVGRSGFMLLAAYHPFAVMRSKPNAGAARHRSAAKDWPAPETSGANVIGR